MYTVYCYAITFKARTVLIVIILELMIYIDSLLTKYLHVRLHRKDQEMLYREAHGLLAANFIKQPYSEIVRP